MPKLEVISRPAQGDKKPTPLLFVHGAWHGAWCWDEYFLPYFAGLGYDAHAVSLRHHGSSEAPGSIKTVRIRDYVDDVASVAETLDAPPVIIGHSMGGFVLQHYLRDHTPAGAVLFASTPPAGVLPLSVKMLFAQPAAFMKANLTLSLYHLVAKPEAAKGMFFSDDMPGERASEFHARLTDESFTAFLGLMFSLPNPKRATVTPLVLGGETDVLVTPKVVRATAAAYGTEAVIFENTAHDMMLEPRWQAVAEHIAQWLDRTL